MVLFVVPIPGKVMDSATNGATNLYKSFKNQPPSKTLSNDPNDPLNAKDESSSGQTQSYAPQGYNTQPPPASNLPHRRSAVPPPPGRNPNPNPNPNAGPQLTMAQAKTTWGAVKTLAPMAHTLAAAAPARASAAAPPAGTYTAELLAHTLSSITLLETLGAITPDAAEAARDCLAGANTKAAPSSPVAATPQRAALAPPARARPVPAAKQERTAKALWDYEGPEDDDLSFTAGDVIVVDEVVNDQWCRGRVVGGDKEGLFPKNYVEMD